DALHVRKGPAARTENIRPALRQRFGDLFEPQDGGLADCFGRTEKVYEDVTEPLDGFLENYRSNGRPGEEDILHAGKVVITHFRVVGQEEQHGSRKHTRCDSVLLHAAHEFLRFPLRHNDGGCTAVHVVHQNNLPRGMKKGTGDDSHVVPIGSHLNIEASANVIEVAVGSHTAFGKTGGAARIHQGGQVVFGDLDGRFQAGGLLRHDFVMPQAFGGILLLADEDIVPDEVQTGFDLFYGPQELLVHHECRNPGVGQNRQQFGGGQSEIQHHEDQSGIGYAEVRFRALNAVPAQNGNPFTFFQTKPEQRIANAVGTLREILECVLPVTFYQ